ncbi:MAG: glycosyltransferase [Anaerotignum sp.]|nr:glycosyltransferase [Anaerotignum sp.]
MKEKLMEQKEILMKKLAKQKPAEKEQEERKIRVLHVLTDRNIGGAGRWLLYYLKYHNRETFEVKAVLPHDSLLVDAVKALDVPVIAMEEMEDKSFDKKAMKALVKLFREEKPDIVHTHASMTARMAARVAGVPSIFNTKHCMEAAPGILPKKILRREVNAAFSDKIIAVSRAVRRSMVHAGTHPEQIAVVYNGIEPIAIPTAEEKAALLASFGGKAGEKAVGMVARLEEVKDHETFLLGAQNVLEKRKDVRFYIIGDGSLREELERRTMELGISEHVTFAGFIKDVEKIEGALDIAVITSKAEALCLSIIESMIAGIPAVGTDSGGVAEVIKHGENGFLVPIGDADALAGRIEELLADDEKRKAFGEHAKKHAESMFMADKMTKRIEKLYLEARK